MLPFSRGDHDAGSGYKLNHLITSGFQIASLRRQEDGQIKNIKMGLWQQMWEIAHRGSVLKKSQVGSTINLSAIPGVDCALKNINWFLSLSPSAPPPLASLLGFRVFLLEIQQLELVQGMPALPSHDTRMYGTGTRALKVFRLFVFFLSCPHLSPLVLNLSISTLLSARLMEEILGSLTA